MFHSAESATVDFEDSFSFDGKGREETEVIEWSGPLMAKVEPWMNIPWTFLRRLKANPDQIVIERKPSIGSYLRRGWQPVTAAQFADEVSALGRGFIARGLQPGDAIAVMAPTCYEWTLIDYAAWSAGLIVVPIYETSSHKQIQAITTATKTRLVICWSTQLANIVRASCTDLDSLEQVIALDDGVGLLDLVESGRSVAEAALEERRNALNADTIATIVFTSGTTGKPKGAMLSHGNFVSLALNGHEWMPEVANQKDSRLLLFLPLAHVYARFLQVFQLSGAGILGHTPNIKNLLADLASFRPSYLLSVPRVLEKIYNSADAQAGVSKQKKKIFRWAANIATRYSLALDTEEGPSRSLNALRLVADRLVFSKITQLMGGNVSYIVSGGAPLGKRLGHFYRGIGVRVLEGYGLTETTAPLAVNTPRLTKIGTVGPPISTVSVRIADDGEVLVKGPSVFKGYLNDPEATAHSFTSDGWYRTGDLGSLDRDGYLRITGRAKDIIVTAGGKNVAPAPLEDSLRGHPLISQVVVVGDGRPFISALVTLDKEMLPGWLRSHKLPVMDAAVASRHPEVLQALDRAVERANRDVSRAESIRKISVLVQDFTEENGMLTPSLKVKRPVVLRAFAQQIDALYGGPA